MKKHTQSSHQLKYSPHGTGQNAKSSSPQKRSGGGALMGLFAGLVIGVLVALGLVLYLNKAPLPFQDKYEGATKAAKDKPAAAATDASNPPGAPLPLPGKPGDKVKDPKQRFEFYGILEGKQAATPQGNPPATTPTTNPPSAPGLTPAATLSTSPPSATDGKAASTEIYFLQAGAFQKAADADNLKAKLALGGLEVTVQEVSVPDKGTMHRVRVGPYRTPAEMNQARNVLSQSGVQASVVKQKE